MKGNGIAAALLSHGLGNKGRGAHLAGDALRADVEADRAADVAGVGNGDDVAVGLLVKEEADLGGLALGVVDEDAKAVELVVVDIGSGDGDLPADEGDGGGGGEGGRALGVDELGGGEKDEEKGDADDGRHPETLAAMAPLGFTAIGGAGGGGDDGGGAAAALEQDHEADEGEHGDEEEEVVADDGANEAHFGGRRGQDAVFGELMQAGDDELEGNEVEDDGGDAEEALQVDAHAAADEHDAEDDGEGEAEDGAGEGEDLGGVEGDGGEDEDGLDAFAEDEEEDKEEEADLGRRGAGVAGDLRFDLALHGAGGLVHEPDHADNKGRGGQHDPAFDDVGVEVEMGDEDGGEDAGDEGGA